MLLNQFINMGYQAYYHVASWCNGQENVCMTLCNKAMDSNTCNAVGHPLHGKINSGLELMEVLTSDRSDLQLHMFFQSLLA